MTTGTGLSPYPSRAADHPVLVDRVDPVVWGTPVEGPLDADGLGRFEQAGFLPIAELLGLDEVEELLAEVNRLASDPDLRGDERVITEPGSGEVRSVFEVHLLSEAFARLFADPRLVDPIRQILGSDVYIHQSRINRKPGMRGREFYWHSDFETWHLEDGMPRMRAVSASIALSANRADNGSLMVIPGSHRTFVGCVGETPDEHYKESLRKQEVGVPDDDSLTRLVATGGIATCTGEAGSATLFDCNAMHGSNGNITPFGRCNVFVVYNSVDNALVDPFGGSAPRPDFLGAREIRPITPSAR